MTLNETGQIILNLDKRVTLKPYQPRAPLPYTLMTDTEIMNGSGGTLIVDTETYSNYHLIAFKDHNTKKIIRFEINLITGEVINERKLAWVVNSYRTVGFNSLKYDMPLIWLAYAYNDVAKIKEASDDLILSNMFHGELQSKYSFKIFPSNHVDLIEVCPLKGSLKLYGARLHSKRIQELPFNPHKELTEREIEIVADYNLNDLDNTELIMDNLTEQLKLRQDMSLEYKVDVMSKSDAQIAETIIGSELKRITGKWPKKPQIDNYQFLYNVPPFIAFQTEPLKNVLFLVANSKFQLSDGGKLLIPKEIADLKIKIGNGVYRLGIGGLHSSEETVAVKEDDEFELCDFDVESYYPRILLNQKLYPEHIGPDFLTIYDHFVESRIIDKKAKRLAQSENKKVIINGTFGKTGSVHSILFSPQITIQITVTGQLALLMLIEYLEMNGFEVVSANTDGIVIRSKRRRKQELLAMVKLWEQHTNFKTEETNYSAVYSRDVNAYMAIKRDGSVKGKNVYYDPWRGKTAKDKYWRFQKNPTCQICVEAVEMLITKQIPLEKTIRECDDITKFVAVKNVKGGAHKDSEYLGKVVRWYYGKGELGTLNYVLNNHKVPDTDGAVPLMDLPDTLPTNIDYERYVRNAISLLEDCAYIKKPQQIKFF